jgi:hypothetical protein
VLIAIIKKRLNVEASPYTILQILSITLFEKVPLVQMLTDFDYRKIETNTNLIPNQLKLF